ncbi:hypothetical protein QQG55_53725 [Brugia pahangi]
MPLSWVCCDRREKLQRIYITHRKTHGQPFIYECKVPGCGRTFNYGPSFRSHKQTHEPNPQCKIVANSSPPGIHCNIIRASAKQNLVSLQI